MDITSDLASVKAFGGSAATPAKVVKQTGLCRLALIVRNGRKYIFKTLLPAVAHIPQYQALLRKEFDIVISLEHPYILRCIDFESHPELGDGILMEWIDGMTLSEYLATEPPLAERYRVACQLADALAYAHAKSIAHRDLKPDNVMVTHSRHDIRLIDFGLADADDFLIMKQSGATEAFGAPEQLDGTASDCRSDVYSFGLLLKMLCPERRYSRLAERCLAVDPDRRPTMEEVADRLGALSAMRRRPFMKLTAIAATVVLIGGGGYYLLRAGQTQEETDSEPPVVRTESFHSDDPGARRKQADPKVLKSLVTVLKALPPETFDEPEDSVSVDYRYLAPMLSGDKDSLNPVEILRMLSTLPE